MAEEMQVKKRTRPDRNLYKRTIAECVRDVIYKDKANIVDKIVAQASRECRTKAIKKLLEEADHA